LAGVTTQRIEAFSDGVFAIAITLLILEVRLPPDDGSPLAHRLTEAWPGYVAFLISFLVIGIMWANHHSDFHLIGRATHGLVVANLLLLLCVSFVPFPTKILAEELRHAGDDQRVAALLYNGTFVVTATLFNLVWRVAATGNRLIRPGADAQAAAAEVTRRYRFGVPSYLAAFLAAIWSVPLSLAINGGLALFYLRPRRVPDEAGLGRET
jgi:uncharacterized membrane protein